MGRNEETTSIKGQEDQATLEGEAFSYATTCIRRNDSTWEFSTVLATGQTNIPKGPVKRQVAEAWKKMKSNEGACSNTLGSQYQCQCYKHYGFPYLQNKSNKREVKVNPSCEANVVKKRKTVSPEPELGSNQHSSSTTWSHLAPILDRMNSDSEVSQAKIT